MCWGRQGAQVVVSPWLLTAGTDSKQYRSLPGAENTYRFNPMAMNRTAGDMRTIHGVNERVGVESFLDSIVFYARFLSLILASDSSCPA